MRNDQATGLRELFGRRGRAVVAVCGSDAAVLTARLADTLAELGRHPVVVDRSLGDIAKAYAVPARFDLMHVLDGDCSLDQVLLTTAAGVAVLPAARGLERIAAHSGAWQCTLEAAVPALAERFDVWIVHGVPPGPTPEAPIVLTLSPTAAAITWVYGQLKALAQAQGRRDFGVVVQRAPTPAVAREVFNCIAETAQRFLGARLDFLGDLPGGRGTGHGNSRLDRARHAAYIDLAQTLVPELSSPARALATAS